MVNIREKWIGATLIDTSPLKAVYRYVDDILVLNLY